MACVYFSTQPGFKEKKNVRFSALYLQKKRNLLRPEHFFKNLLARDTRLLSNVSLGLGLQRKEKVHLCAFILNNENQNWRDLPRNTPLDRVEVLDDLTLRAENPVKEILLKLNLPDHSHSMNMEINIGLLFKWIWRFLCNHSDLWICVIKSIHGVEGGINIAPNRSLKRSTWASIIASIHSLKAKGIDLVSFCTRKIGNGIDSSFWNDLWCGNHSLKEMFPRIYNLETDKRCSIASRIGLQDWALVLRRNPRGGEESGQFNALKNVIGNISLTDHRDCWQWSLGGSAGFTVASIRSLVDSHSLDIGNEATHWNRSLPIKVNVFLWRLKINKLPSMVNLDRRGIEVSSLLCPSCLGDLETVNHTFFNCDLAKDMWSLLAKWWELDIPVCGNIKEWYDWLGGVHVSSKVRLFLEGVGGTLMWFIWNFRNLLNFSSFPPRKATI
ncbi:RNA-directed DNA polymerase, eukaryota, reverse transcriptase zinc-binding domain protein [Tanacetum coccineum]